MKKKGLILTAAGICLVAAAVTVSLLAGRETGSAETVSVGENQRIVYGYLTSVLGNEISYTEIETSVAEAMLEKQQEKSDEKMTSDGEEASSGTGDDSMPEGAPQDMENGNSGEQPSGMEAGDSAGGASQGMENDTLGEQSSGMEAGDFAGKAPQDMENGVSGEQPSGMEAGDSADGEQSGRGGRGSKQGKAERAASDEEGTSSNAGAGGVPSDIGEGSALEEASQSTESSTDEGWGRKTGMQSGIGSGESVTALIPVGTVVHTTTDTETTFSRLAAGDFVKLLLETTEDGGETIVEIWMVQ